MACPVLDKHIYGLTIRVDLTNKIIYTARPSITNFKVNQLLKHSAYNWVIVGMNPTYGDLFFY